MSVTESQFADDAALYTTSRSNMETMCNEFVSSASRWGLTVSIRKTKGLSVSGAVGRPGVVLHSGGTVDVVSDFTYLGGIVSDDGALDKEVSSRLAKAARVFGSLRKPILELRGLTIQMKRMVYKSIVLGTLLYGAETWAVKAEHLRKLNVVHRACIRSILGVSRARQRMDHLTSVELARRCNIESDIAEVLRQRRLRWRGYIARMDDSPLPKQVLFGELPSKRPRHGPRFRDVSAADLVDHGIT